MPHPIEVRDLMRVVDSSIDPENMTSEEALEYLELLVEEAKSRINGIKDDIRIRE